MGDNRISMECSLATSTAEGSMRSAAMLTTSLVFTIVTAAHGGSDFFTCNSRARPLVDNKTVFGIGGKVISPHNDPLGIKHFHTETTACTPAVPFSVNRSSCDIADDWSEDMCSVTGYPSGCQGVRYAYPDKIYRSADGGYCITVINQDTERVKYFWFRVWNDPSLKLRLNQHSARKH